MSDILILSTGERLSPVWRKLHAHFKQKFIECRAQNDGPLDPTATAGMRARIAVYASLLELDEDRPNFGQE